jgi:hypothetical protein
MQLEKYLSVLDTERFGFKIVKIDTFDYPAAELLAFFKANDVKLILSKISAENLDLINELEHLKFELKDIQVTYKYDLHKNILKDKTNTENILIREAKITDIEFLQTIASDSFLNYGHYANDDKLDKIKCRDIYSDWIKRSCEDENVANKVFVAECDGELAGFLAIKILSQENKRYAAGTIGAVSEKFRNQNIFRLITLEVLHWSKQEGLDWVENNVLITNYPVNSSFVKSGFLIYKSFITLHHWIE